MNYGNLKTTEKGRMIEAPHCEDISDFLVGVLVHSVDVQDVDSAGDLLKRIRGLYCWLKAILTDSICNRYRSCSPACLSRR
jgi:hypothetical protein